MLLIIIIVVVAVVVVVLGDSVPAFRVKLSAHDLNCVDVPLNPTHSLTHASSQLASSIIMQAHCATAQRIRFWTIGLMPSDIGQLGHAKDVPLPGEIFRRRAVLELLTVEFDQSSRNRAPNSVFRKSDPITEENQNAATKLFKIS